MSPTINPTISKNPRVYKITSARRPTHNKEVCHPAREQDAQQKQSKQQGTDSIDRIFRTVGITENQEENERRDASTGDDGGVGSHRSTGPTGLAIEHSGEREDREPEHHGALQIAFEAEQAHH